MTHWQCYLLLMRVDDSLAMLSNDENADKLLVNYAADESVGD